MGLGKSRIGSSWTSVRLDVLHKVPEDVGVHSGIRSPDDPVYRCAEMLSRGMSPTPRPAQVSGTE